MLGLCKCCVNKVIHNLSTICGKSSESLDTDRIEGIIGETDREWSRSEPESVMSDYKCESVVSRLVKGGMSYDEAEKTLAITHRHPTIKRFEGIDPDAKWRPEVESALSSLVGVILSEGYRFENADESVRTDTMRAVSSRIIFREEPRTSSRRWIYVEIDCRSVKPFGPDGYTATSFDVTVAKHSDGMSTENRTRVTFRSTTERYYDLYDLMVDGLIPGIERLSRFVAGTCEYLG